MSIDTLIALMGFTFVVSISPGPGNIMLLNSGANFGFRQSIPLVLGICVGFMSIVLLAGFGLEMILQRWPDLYLVLKVVSSLYVLKLAWNISQTSNMGSRRQDKLSKPVTMVQAALLQMVSPKVWAVAPIMTVSYTNPDNYLTSLLLLVPICAMVNIPSTSVWAISGVALKQILSNQERLRHFNYLMALMLAGSMIPVLASAF